MSIQDLVFEKVATQLGVDKNTLNPEKTFSELGADSLDMVEFSLEVEDAFSITINQADIANIKTLGNAIEFIEKNKK
jgi:acyl carrier protein